MQIQKETKDKRKATVIALIVITLIGTACYGIYFIKLQQDGVDDSVAQERFESDRIQSEVLSDTPETKNEAPNTDHPSLPTNSTESGKKQVKMVASADQSGGTVFIRGGVNYPVTDGICYAQLVGPSGQSIRKDSIVLPGPASTDCRTISIPVNELTPGNWKFILHYASDNYEGASVETPFTI